MKPVRLAVTLALIVALEAAPPARQVPAGAAPGQGAARGAAPPTTVVAPLAASARLARFRVRDAAGIRRYGYPVVAHLPIDRGALADPARARLRTGDAEVPAQPFAISLWDDGSVRELAVAFNVSIGPMESVTYQLEYGEGVPPVTPPRGLTVAEESDAVQAGNLRFNKKAGPLVVSASYRAEFIGQGTNGVSVVDNAGIRHDVAGTEPRRVELSERGPLLAVLRYEFAVPIAAGYIVPIQLTLEAPNSKAWFKVTLNVSDPLGRLREIAFELPLAFGAHPWTWDFGTLNGTYGAFRAPTDAAMLTYRVPLNGPGSWRVETGTIGSLTPYEASPGPQVMAGWAHIQDATKAVAFAVENFGTTPAGAGTYTISLDGQGQAAIRFAPPQPATEHRLVLYAHFVGTPVAIGAATSPASILKPLVVEMN